MTEEDWHAEAMRLAQSWCDVERRHCIGKAQAFDIIVARDALAAHLRSRPDHNVVPTELAIEARKLLLDCGINRPDDAAIALDPNHPATEPFEVRVAGPDDVIAFSDELEALQCANAVNKEYLEDRLKNPDNEVLCVATVHEVLPPPIKRTCHPHLHTPLAEIP